MHSRELLKRSASLEAPEVTLSDNMTSGSGFFCVSRNRFVGDEVPIAFDGKAELAAHGGDFRKADISELRTAEPKIAEAEEKTVFKFG